MHQRLPERGRGRCNEVDTGVSNMGAVTQVQGTELRSVAQEEPQGGIGELQACQAKFCHPLQSPSAFSLPWADKEVLAFKAPPTLGPLTPGPFLGSATPLKLFITCPAPASPAAVPEDLCHLAAIPSGRPPVREHSVLTYSTLLSPNPSI